MLNILLSKVWNYIDNICANIDPQSCTYRCIFHVIILTGNFCLFCEFSSQLIKFYFYHPIEIWQSWNGTKTEDMNAIDDTIKAIIQINHYNWIAKMIIKSLSNLPVSSAIARGKLNSVLSMLYFTLHFAPGL